MLLLSMFGWKYVSYKSSGGHSHLPPWLLVPWLSMITNGTITAGGVVTAVSLH